MRDFEVARNTTYFLKKFDIVKPEDTTPDTLDRLQELMIAEHFGWTLEYVRNLGLDDEQTIRGMFEGRNQAKDE